MPLRDFLGLPLRVFQGVNQRLSESPKKNVNSKINLALAAAGAAGAVASLIGQIPSALAGPTLTGNSTQTYDAGATFSLQTGQSFEAIGNYSGTVNPFAVTETGTGLGNLPVAGILGAGTSTLTAAFDRNGFANTVNTGSTLATPSLAVQAGIIQLGGSAPTACVTTGPCVNGVPTNALKAGLPLAIVLNQNATSGLPSVDLVGASSDTGIVGASITSELIGSTGATGSITDSLTVINSLSAF